jgi:hypothetical protein
VDAFFQRFLNFLIKSRPRTFCRAKKEPWNKPGLEGRKGVIAFSCLYGVSVFGAAVLTNSWAILSANIPKGASQHAIRRGRERLF